MHIEQATYRELYDSLLAYKGTSAYPDVLAPWLKANAREQSWLCSFASREGACRLPTGRAQHHRRVRTRRTPGG